MGKITGPTNENRSAEEQHVRRTLTLTHTITAYSVSGNVVRVRILICATRQKPSRKSLPYISYAADKPKPRWQLTPDTAIVYHIDFINYS